MDGAITVGMRQKRSTLRSNLFCWIRNTADSRKASLTLVSQLTNVFLLAEQVLLQNSRAEGVAEWTESTCRKHSLRALFGAMYETVVGNRPTSLASTPLEYDHTQLVAETSPGQTAMRVSSTHSFSMSRKSDAPVPFFVLMR